MFQFQKDFDQNDYESKSLFSHFMTKSFKVHQRNMRITIYANVSNKSLVRNRVCEVSC